MPDGERHRAVCRVDRPLRLWVDERHVGGGAARGEHAEGSLAPADDFFKKLGIDSLQTLEMLSRIENYFGIELPDYEVQGVSDFRTLAERIQSRL